MKKRSVERSMFYNAPATIFENARLLRRNMTEAEKLLWKRLRKKQLGVRFKAQHPIERFIADFYCHSARLVVELDGETHKYQKEYDIGREGDMEKYDITVIRFKNHEVLEDIEKIVEKIQEYL